GDDGDYNRRSGTGTGHNPATLSAAHAMLLASEDSELCESFRTILGEAAEVAEAVERQHQQQQQYQHQRQQQYQDHLYSERSDAGSEPTEGERVPKAHVVALDSPKSPVSTTRPSALFLPSDPLFADTKVMLAELEQDLADLGLHGPEGAGAGPPARAEQIHEQASHRDEQRPASEA
ncbi:unnamed protein product, partial [Polarella glacialis]